MLSWTWRLIGVLANSAEDNHIPGFFAHGNLLELCQSQLAMDETTKNSLFAISNILADRHTYIEEAIRLRLFESLHALYGSLQSMDNSKLKEILRQELVYCFGNTTIGAKDTLRASQRDLVGAMLKQGGLHTLTSIVREGSE